jgi:hypothetical protein
MGLRVRCGDQDDLLAVSNAPALRRYGTELTTDAEAAYVRRDANGRILEAGIINGRLLEFAGQKLIELSPDVVAAHVRFTDPAPQVHTTGQGELTVWKSATEPIRLAVGTPGPLTLTPPKFSTALKDLRKALGAELPEAKPDMVVVTWTTSSPSDATIEYAGIRTTNPEPTTTHRFLLSRLEAAQEYDLRITCRSADGAVGKIQTLYTHEAP